MSKEIELAIEEKLLTEMPGFEKTVAALGQAFGLPKGVVQAHLVSIFQRRVAVDTAAVAEELAVQWQRDEALGG